MRIPFLYIFWLIYQYINIPKKYRRKNLFTIRSRIRREGDISTLVVFHPIFIYDY